MSYHGGVELKRVYAPAQAEDFAFVASNVAEPNVLIGLIEGAAQADSDLLVQLSTGACTFVGSGDPIAGLQLMGGYVERIATQYDVGVFLNMDHQTDLDVIRRQVDLDIPSSIMVDASHEPFEENVARSREVVETVGRAGADILVEAELGRSGAPSTGFGASLRPVTRLTGGGRGISEEKTSYFSTSEMAM